MMSSTRRTGASSTDASRPEPKAGKPPRTMAVVTSKFPSGQFISAGMRDIAPTRGLKVPLYLEQGTVETGVDAGRGLTRQTER